MRGGWLASLSRESGGCSLKVWSMTSIVCLLPCLLACFSSLRFGSPAATHPCPGRALAWQVDCAGPRRLCAALLQCPAWHIPIPGALSFFACRSTR
jgi:hypothetical protein